MRRIQFAVTLLLMATFVFLPIWTTVIPDFPSYSALPYLVLTVLFLGIILRLRIAAQLHPLILIGSWMLIYFAELLIWLFIQGSDFTAYGQNRMLLEVVASAVLIYLAQLASSGIHQVKDSLIELGLHDMPQRLSANSIENTVQSELMRSRYTGHPLSVISVTPNIKQSHDEVQYSNELMNELEFEFGKQYLLTKITRNIRRNIRFIDKLYQDEETGRLIIVCPEMQQSEGQALSQIIQQNISQELGINPDCSVSSFPKEGFTLESLLENSVEVRT